MTETPTIDALRAALFEANQRIRGMDDIAFRESLDRFLAEYDGEEITEIKKLTALAADGAIIAVAMLVRLTIDRDNGEQIVADALGKLAARSDDVSDELFLEYVEKFLDEEVASGRLTMTVDPISGKKLLGRPGDEA